MVRWRLAWLALGMVLGTSVLLVGAMPGQCQYQFSTAYGTLGVEFIITDQTVTFNPVPGGENKGPIIRYDYGGRAFYVGAGPYCGNQDSASVWAEGYVIFTLYADEATGAPLKPDLGGVARPMPFGSEYAFGDITCTAYAHYPGSWAHAQLRFGEIERNTGVVNSGDPDRRLYIRYWVWQTVAECTAGVPFELYVADSGASTSAGVSFASAAQVNCPGPVLGPPPLGVDAGPDQTVAEGDTVALSAACAAPVEPMTYRWLSGGAELGEGELLEVVLPVGTHTVTLEGTDGLGRVATDDVLITVGVLNQPPTAEAGPDQTVEANTTGGADVELNGSGSSDPDGDDLACTWDLDGDGVFETPGVTVTHFYALGGPHTGTLRATDPSGESDTDSVSITVVDTTAPALAQPAAVTEVESSPAGTPVALSAPSVSDVCDGDVVPTSDAPAFFALGDTTVTWAAQDDSGNVATALQVVTVIPGPPENQLDNLGELVSIGVVDGDIAPELEGSLLAKVHSALDAVARGNKNDAKVAMNNLKALVNEVNAQADKKISAEASAAIIARADRLISDLEAMMACGAVAGDHGAIIISASAAPAGMGAEVLFTLGGRAGVSVTVMNVAGRPVRRLCTARPCEAGSNTLLWNAQADNGLRVPGGLYLVEIEARGANGSRSRAITQLTLTR